MKQQEFIVIGLDDNRQQHFSPEVLGLIESRKMFSGGVRHKEIVGHLLPPEAEWINITVPLDDVFSRYEGCEQVVVFASGDPLFFGFANTLLRRLPEARIRLYPAFNSLQTLAHRLLMPYDDMRIVSLTGRPWQEFDRALIERSAKIGILTDREHTPDVIAERMLEYGYDSYLMHVGEHLGNDERELVRTLTLKEAASTKFEHPNNLILTANKTLAPRLLGIPDEEFDHLEGRSRMITKAPIRLLSLRELELGKRSSFWDIGFCTGSISIEARLQFPHLNITAFEIRPEGGMLMQVNSRRFGTPGITVVIGDFMQADLSAYPHPDAVFVGGHGGQLGTMLSRVNDVLSPDGCVVFNSVSPESREAFAQAVEQADMKLLPPLCITLNDYNPIHILKAIKK